ncbi:Zn-ribbon domain-containing OB-fold protein [Tardiphaga sp.]|jgi:uncharacterized OB-fold protein|uniref:Zn-ribbon domain-containing OB-fold protein n=1 Tax=Tardiphaga sp. TaxID=1926292 RepID=UPI0037DA32B3
MADEIETHGPEDVYSRNLAQGVFALQTCEDCRATVFPPKLWCSACESERLSWAPCSGEGVVYSCTTVRATEKGQRPYNVSLIELDVGVRMMSTIVGILPDDVRIGARVTARVEASDGAGRVVFDPIQTEEA